MVDIINPKVINLNKAIDSMHKILRRLIGEDIELSWFPGEEIWPVIIDSSQVDQILANLCVNARDAISDVGKVVIETKTIAIDEKFCTHHAGFVSGDCTMLTVRDDGKGMSPETLDKIFEPFFTTKGVGQGTGLGLSTVYGIVKQNNGFIYVDSELEKGTTIEIYLPRYTVPAVKKHIENPVKIAISHGETVLFVEDDVSILKLGKSMLESLGYTVLTANSPGVAMALAKERKTEIDLLITDVIMPEMNGHELAEQLQSIYPNLKTLYISGYTADIIAHRGVLEKGVNFMPKPFLKKDLAVKIRQILDHKNA